jgi:hypothetical protein
VDEKNMYLAAKREDTDEPTSKARSSTYYHSKKYPSGRKEAHQPTNNESTDRPYLTPDYTFPQNYETHQ